MTYRVPPPQKCPQRLNCPCMRVVWGGRLVSITEPQISHLELASWASAPCLCSVKPTGDLGTQAQVSWEALSFCSSLVGTGGSDRLSSSIFGHGVCSACCFSHWCICHLCVNHLTFEYSSYKSLFTSNGVV